MANQPKKYKKFVATAATATLVASAIVPVASAASLSDIAGNTHEEAINALVDAKVISGYPDGTFKPNKTLTRSDVVKLLGKYLVAEGYEIPSDAVSNPRFSDLSSKSNKELLEYAAVVADNGVFNGSNGKLLAGDNITRENMAIVLVRMVNTLKDVSLEEYVDAQNFKGDVKDLNAAKAEARTAIKVLDFYDITNPSVANFNPKGDTTRGQFATFLHKTINTDFAGAAVTGTVKAINATTVEVTFGEDVKDIKALDFAISGLEVSNAVVKQSDKKTVVLTTSPQTAGVEYTVTVNGDKVGKFVGVSAVIPTAVKVVEHINPVVEGKETIQVGSHTSQQAPLGTQVTLKAQVTVAEGQSKAGIPVTFNIIDVSNKEGAYASLNQPIIAEAKTDENGVATYTYTRYASTAYQLDTSDEVQVYATGNPTARDFSKVYWASIQPLTLTEVTQGNSLNNGAKKVYKVKLANGANKVINVGFLDNVNVEPNKANKKVTITDASGKDWGYPGQFTTSDNTKTNNYKVTIKLDSKGEATFTLTGSNETVTPFVFVDQSAVVNTDPTVGRFDKSELAAFAPPVTFAKIQNLGLTHEAHGVQDSAAASVKSKLYTTTTREEIKYLDVLIDGKIVKVPVGTETVVSSSLNLAYYNANFANGKVLSAKQYSSALENVGGRAYSSVLTDDKGVKAPEGTVVKVKVATGTSKNKNAIVYLADNNSKRVYPVTDGQEITLYTDKNGQVSYRLFGEQDSYATPTVFTETGDKLGLDTNDLQQVADRVDFDDAIINTAKLTIVDSETHSSVVADKATITYATVDQNGFQYFDGNEFVATFQLTTTFSGATVYYKDVVTGEARELDSGSSYSKLDSGSSYSNTVAVKSEDGIATIDVESVRGNRVDVVASASQSSLPILTGSVTFSKVTNEGIEAGQSVTGKVVAIDYVANRILLTNAAGTKTYELDYSSANLITRNSPNSIKTFEGQLSVEDELKFTQKTETTNAATFHNYDYDASRISTEGKVTVVIAKDTATYDESAEEIAKGYDFGGTVFGSATDKARFEILGNNTILKNATINGDIIVDEKVFNNFTLENVTVNGNVIVRGAKGGTITIKGSTINGTVDVENTGTILLDSSTITTVDANNYAVNINGKGTVGKVLDGYNTKISNDVTVTDKTSQELVEEEAAKITTAPAIKDNKLQLPTVAEGYTVAIKSSSEAVIKKDGTVVPAETATTVDVVLTVTNAKGEKADTKVLKVEVPAKETEAGDDVTVGGIENIDIKEPLVGLVGLTIKLTEAVKSGLEVTEASTLVVTLADGTVVEAAYTAATEGFTFAFKGKTQDAVKAGKVTIK